MSVVFGSMIVICACSGLKRLMMAWPMAARVVVLPHNWRPITSMLGNARVGRATGCSRTLADGERDVHRVGRLRP